MPRLGVLRSVLLGLAVVVALPTCGQRRTKSPSDSAQSQKKKPAKTPRLRLPKPLALPQQPLVGAHVAEPARTLAAFDPYVDVSLEPTLLLRRELGRVTSSEMATTIAGSIDAAQPWSAARLSPQHEIAYLPVRANARADVARRLGALPKEGDFGGVRLPAPDGVAPGATAPVLAWLDPRDGMLTLARTVRGLVTGPKLREKYGTSPLALTVSESQLPADVPFANVRADGELDDLGVIGQFRPGTDVFAQNELRPGALTGLLADPATVVGASTRWAGSDAFVRDTITQIRREVGKQSFLIKGVLDDLSKKFFAVLRKWDGRVMAGLSGPGHVRLAFGTDDVAGGETATLRLFQQLVANVSLLRNFTNDVPGLSLQKKQANVGGTAVHLVTVSGAYRQLPEQVRPLLDNKKRLRIAVSFSSRAGAGMVVIGPDAVDELERWLRASTSAPSGADTAGDVVAMAFAVPPEQVLALATAGDDPSMLWKLDATGRRHELVARRKGKSAAELRISRDGGPTRQSDKVAVNGRSTQKLTASRGR